MLTALVTFAPLILQFGSWLIGIFSANAQTAAANRLAFYNAIQAHVNDAVASASEHLSYAQQVTDLRSQIKPDPAVPPVVPSNPTVPGGKA